MDIIQNLSSYQVQIQRLDFGNSSSNYMVKKALKNAVKFLIINVKERTPIDKLEKIWFNNFLSLEEFGWDFRDNEKVLQLWISLGNIIGIDEPEAKINFIATNEIDLFIKKLEEYTKAQKVFNEMPEYPLFYSSLKKIMNEEINEIIEILHKSTRIDLLLNQFEKGLDKFESLNHKTTDYTFGDTVDRETIGEFYTKIMNILGIRFSRGLLSKRL